MHDLRLSIPSPRQGRSTRGSAPTLVLAALALGILLLGACSIQADASIAANRRATVNLEALVHPVLQAYLKDLAGSGGTAEFFDAARIRARLAEEPGVTVKSLSASLEGGLKMNLDIADLQKLFSQRDAVKSVFSLGPEAGGTVLRIRLDRAAVESFLGLGLPKDDKSLRYLLPQNASLSADKYRENLRWAFEEYGSADELADLFKKATIDLRLSVPGAIRSASGFTVVDKAGGKLALKLSLLELMTLQGVRQYEARY